jgi:hypothetical protein
MISETTSVSSAPVEKTYQTVIAHVMDAMIYLKKLVIANL